MGRLLAGLGGAVAGIWGGAKLGAGVGIATGGWGNGSYNTLCGCRLCNRIFRWISCGRKTINGSETGYVSSRAQRTRGKNSSRSNC